jgi:hypothetical protein
MTPSASGERQGDSPTSTPTSVRVYIPTLSWTRMPALMQMLELIWIPALTQIPALMPTRTPSYHLICYVIFILLTVSSSSLTLMRRFVAHVILGSEVHFVALHSLLLMWESQLTLADFGTGRGYCPTQGHCSASDQPSNSLTSLIGTSHCNFPSPCCRILCGFCCCFRWPMPDWKL